MIETEKKVLNFTVLIEQDEDGIYVAKERIKEAIQVCLEADDEEIMPLKFIGVQQLEVIA